MKHFSIALVILGVLGFFGTLIITGHGEAAFWVVILVLIIIGFL